MYPKQCVSSLLLKDTVQNEDPQSMVLVGRSKKPWMETEVYKKG